jgi:hypothetical protein
MGRRAGHADLLHNVGSPINLGHWSEALRVRQEIGNALVAHGPLVAFMVRHNCGER